VLPCQIYSPGRPGAGDFCVPECVYIFFTQIYFWLKGSGVADYGPAFMVSPALITRKAGTSWPAGQLLVSQDSILFFHNLLYDICFCFLLLLLSLFIVIFSVVSRFLLFFFLCLIRYFPFFFLAPIFVSFVLQRPFSSFHTSTFTCLPAVRISHCTAQSQHDACSVRKTGISPFTVVFIVLRSCLLTHILYVKVLEVIFILRSCLRSYRPSQVVAAHQQVLRPCGLG